MTTRRSGKVTRQEVAPGSKSAHDAVVLETSEGTYVLRRKGGNPFRDTALDELVGKQLVVDGDMHGTDLIMSDWHEVDTDEASPPAD